MQERSRNPKQYLLASDFDQTLSFHDSGIVLSELLGTSGFEERVAGIVAASTSHSRARNWLISAVA